MRKRMSHPRKQLLFILLSLTDLMLTLWLLGHSDGQVYEANPVAQWWLMRYGAAGLACFKAVAVLLVLVLVAIIAHFRPGAAGRALGFGCAILMLVVLYSVAMSWTGVLSPQERAALVEQKTEQETDEINSQTRTEMGQKERLRARLAAVDQDLLDGQCTLHKAANRMAAWAQRSYPPWLQTLAILHPDLPTVERVACCLICRAVTAEAARSEPAAARRVALRLEREFQDTYGHPSTLRDRALLSDIGPSYEDDGPARGLAGLQRPRPQGQLNSLTQPAFGVYIPIPLSHACCLVGL
jgi:hypothetical protein